MKTKKQLERDERRARRARTGAFYRLACTTDLNCRPKFVKLRTIKRGNRPFAIRRWLLHYRAVEIAKKELATTSPG